MLGSHPAARRVPSRSDPSPALSHHALRCRVSQASHLQETDSSRIRSCCSHWGETMFPVQLITSCSRSRCAFTYSSSCLLAPWQPGRVAGTIIPRPHGIFSLPVGPCLLHTPEPQATLPGGPDGAQPPLLRPMGATRDAEVLGTVTSAWARPYLGCGFIVLVSYGFDPGVIQQGRVLGFGPGDRKVTPVSNRWRRHSRQPAPQLRLPSASEGGQPVPFRFKA